MGEKRIKVRSLPRAAVPAIALLLAACGSPESDCRGGIAEMQKKISTMMGSNELRDAVPPLRAELNEARERLAAGDYVACTDAIARARAELNRSQRTNQ